ncbi:MAG: hypothetical protein C0619_13135 [Desulfuromonas sp.]|nr:MAG: hypothetical protein C0619_13135 [Desulfuromonas sp.]
MKDAWEERKKAKENEYFIKKDHELINQMKHQTEEELAKGYSKGRCPKCSEKIEPITFRGVPMDRCPGCGGVWLGPNDLKILAEKDHRTWFDFWFRQDETSTSERGN